MSRAPLFFYGADFLCGSGLSLLGLADTISAITFSEPAKFEWAIRSETNMLVHADTALASRDELDPQQFFAHEAGNPPRFPTDVP